ncbi:hypothetical protein [Rhizobium sp. SYY.PMSO]|uniref:hypothetical protein n=1 Tax=Rhizobium sp. SYY.PMSO TaxID=3382192 RepID=UPI0039902FAC
MRSAPGWDVTALMRGEWRADFLIVIEILSHFGHASPAELCCAAKNLHLPEKKSMRVERFLRLPPSRRRIASKCLSQKGFSSI